MSDDHEFLVSRLSLAGFVAASEEAVELTRCAAGNEDLLESFVSRRLTGEPLAWITGRATFCDLEILIDSGVFVPRWQSEPLAQRAAARLAPRGLAIDLCTGSGAIAKVLTTTHPHARVLACDLDDRAVTCAVKNGVDAYRSDLFSTLPCSLETQVDVIVGVVPYVPTSALSLLPRDTLSFEAALSYDGGLDGTEILSRVLFESSRMLQPGGALLLELGGDQADLLSEDLSRLGFIDVLIHVDDDEDVRGIEATFKGPS